MTKLRKYLIYIIMATFPIMSIINFSGKFKFNTALSDVFIILFFAILIFDIKNIKFKEFFKYWWYFIALIATAVFSYFVSVKSASIVHGSIASIFSEVIKFGIVAVYFYVGYNSFNDKISFKKVLLSWIVGLWLTIITGIVFQVSYWSGKNINWHNTLTDNSRLLGGFTDANLAGTYLTLSFFLVILYYKVSEGRFNKWFSIITMGFTALCIFLTQSRGSMVGFIISAGLFALWNIRKLYKALILLLPICFVLYFGFFDIDYTFLNSGLTDSISDRIELAANGQEQFIIRKNLSFASVMMGLDHPLLGVGRGNFTLNSKQYIDKIYDKRDDLIYSESLRCIPHNTFAGMFAEMGIIGLSIFSSLFVILFIKLFKKRNGLNNIIIFALIAFLVESLVLNLENFRGLWLLIGICFAIQKTDISVEWRTEIKVKFDKWFVIYLTPLIIISSIVFIDTARKTPERVVLADKPFITYINNVRKDHNYSLVYNIKSIGNEEDNSKIRVYEVSGDNERLYKEYEYWKVNGIGKIILNPSENINGYKIEWTGLYNKSTRTILKEMYYIDKNKKIPLINYRFLPKSLEKIFNDNDWLWIRDEKPYKNQTFKLGKIAGGFFELLEVNLKKQDGTENITFKFKALKPIDKNYDIVLEVYTDNINNVLNFDSKNKFTQIYPITPVTTTWKTGEIYEFTVPFKGKNAEYYVSAYISGFPEDKIEIGKLSPDGLSISDYLNNIKNNQIVILSVMDEGASALDPEFYKAINKLGLKADLKGKVRWSYIGITGKVDGITPFEVLKNEKISINYKTGDKLGEFQLPFDLFVESAGYSSGNTSSIIINGKEYSKKQRGINIVVYDIEQGKVIDSINFDTYISIYK